MANICLYDLFDKAAAQHLSRRAVLYNDGRGRLEQLLYNEVRELATSVATLLKRHIDVFDHSSVIAILCKPSLTIPPILIGILQAGAAFCAIDSRDPIASLEIVVAAERRLEYLLTDEESVREHAEAFGEKFETLEELKTMEPTIHLLRLKNENRAAQILEDKATPPIAYVVQTSGTTGTPKIIKVTHECIVPNIQDFCSIFEVVPSDIVIFLAPLTFDPSMIEMFLALSSGATLLIVPDAVKAMPRVLSKVIKDCKVTIMQATPSMVSRFGQRLLREEVMQSDSSLRILALGGECSPSTALLRLWKAEGNKTQLYNLYGTTEVSCWATCHPISESEFSAAEDTEVPIGSPLSQTLIEVRDKEGRVVSEGEGQLFIGSDVRVCLLNGESPSLTGLPVWRATGDWARVSSRRQIFFSHRRDGIVKHNGKKVDLIALQNEVLNLECVESCSVIYEEVMQMAVAFLVPRTGDVQNLLDLTRNILDHLQRTGFNLPPIRITTVPYLPVTSHGKIDKKRLFQFLMEDKNIWEVADSSVGLKDLVARLWKRYALKANQSITQNDNFVYCGGNSVAAVQLALEIEFALRRSIPSLVDTILHGTFSEVLQSLAGSTGKRCLGAEVDENHKTKTVNDQKIKVVNQVITEKPVAVCYENILTRKCFTAHYRSMTFFKCDCSQCLEGTCPLTEKVVSFPAARVRWKFNLLKCIDSSPLVIAYRNGKTVVLVGSHSGIFAAIDGCSGAPFWKVLLKDRIESSPCVSMCGGYVVVGCYDFCLYCFAVETGECRWIFKTKSEVKSSPICDSLINVIYCGSHDRHLYAIHVESGSLKWATCIGEGSIFSSPAICSESPQVYAAALDGTVAAVHRESGLILWTFQCRKPVFSSPLVHTSGVCVGCVSGELLFFDHQGKCKWIFDTQSPIFCSPCAFGTDRMLVGNHGNKVFCLDNATGSLLWQHQTNSQVYSRQCVLGSFVIVVATSGTVHILNAVGQECCQFQIDGQVFSSPVFSCSSLFIGSRNNYLYCYDFS